jgi:hypothetical protein
VCLICGGKIEDGRPTPSDGVAFDCFKHGQYAIARTALPRFLKLSGEAQGDALERAKVFAAGRNGEIIVTSMDL